MNADAGRPSARKPRRPWGDRPGQRELLRCRQAAQQARKWCAP